MKNNWILLVATAILLLANFTWAQGEKAQTPKNENVVQKITSETKKTRKKKVEMCSECGKPEPECECHGHGEKDENKIERKTTSKGN